MDKKSAFKPLKDNEIALFCEQMALILKTGISSKEGLSLMLEDTGSGEGKDLLEFMINYINSTKEDHIITLEDPLEFLHSHKKSIVSQREISSDTESYLTALRAALRQSPDVILLGEMRDFETINVAMSLSSSNARIE